MSDIYCYGTVGDDWGECFTASDVKDQLANCPGDVTIHINSGGGDVFQAYAISSIITQHRKSHPGCKVTTLVEGIAASAASFMGLTADEVVMAPGALMMIHRAATYVFGNSEQLRKAADDLDKTASGIVTLYENKTGKSEEEITAAMEAETWFTDQEAVEFGLADRVDEDVQRMAAKVTSSQLKAFTHEPDGMEPGDGAYVRDMNGSTIAVLEVASVPKDEPTDAKSMGDTTVTIDETDTGCREQESGEAPDDVTGSVTKALLVGGRVITFNQKEH